MPMRKALWLVVALLGVSCVGPGASGPTLAPRKTLTSPAQPSIVRDAQGTEAFRDYVLTVASCSVEAVYDEVIQLEAQVVGVDEQKELKWKAEVGAVTEKGVYTAPTRSVSDVVTVWAAEDPSISDAIHIEVVPKPTLTITGQGFTGCPHEPRYTCGVGVTWTSSSTAPDTFQVCLLMSDGSVRDCSSYSGSGGSYATTVSISRGTFGTPLYTPKYVQVSSRRGSSVTKAIY